MSNEYSDRLIKRVLKKGIILSVVTILVIYFFTSEALYCIMYICGALVSLAGFFVMVKLIDRLLANRKGKLLFFSVSFLKLGLIVLFSIFISRYSEIYFLFFILGLSLIVIALMIEGGQQFYRSIKHGA